MHLPNPAAHGAVPLSITVQGRSLQPVLAIVKYQTAEAVALANDCPVGLGSTVFSSNKARANAIAHQLQVHMLPACHPCFNNLWVTSLGSKGTERTISMHAIRHASVRTIACINFNNLTLLPKFDIMFPDNSSGQPGILPGFS